MATTKEIIEAAAFASREGAAPDVLWLSEQDAAKLYMEATGCGRQEALSWVENLPESEGAKSKEQLGQTS